MNVQTLNNVAQKFGLVLRGSFTATDEDAVPAMPDGQAGRTVVLLGNRGSSLWSQFSSSAEYNDGLENPLDRWSKRVGEILSDELGAAVYFPFGGPPYQPFIAWAKKAEALESSRIGMLIHAEYGLWHAYRMALVFADPIDMDAAVADHQQHVCDTCKDQPCCSTCPVDAFANDRYDVDRCVRFLDEHPGADCNRLGCMARRSCPEGKQYRYNQRHAAFHMKQFVSSRIAAIKNNNN